MKKIIIIAIILVSTFELQAQKFGWGLTAGPSLAYVGGKNNLGEDFIGREILTGFHGGFIFQYNPRRFFTVYSGLEFIQKGSNINSNKNGFRYESNLNQIKLSYLEIPMLIKLNLDPYSNIRPNVFGGLMLGFLAEAKDNFTLPQSMEAGLLSTETFYKRFDPSFSFGGGLDFDIGDWTIFTMGAQYVYGFNKINGNDGYWFSEKASIKNRGIRLNFGVIFVIPTFTMNNSKKKENYDKFKKYLY